MPAPESIIKLVKRFDANRDAYRSGKYNEAQLRQEFLDPFFEALGWDVYNKKDYAPDYREVVSEDSIAIEGQAKAPDYAFRVGGVRKFFVEAKKPSVDIAGDIHPAYQLRRYAWNVHLPLSILTDFEEFAVYDCRNKPDPNDSAATGRTKFFEYPEYIDRWDEIVDLFSPEAILKGSFDKYIIENKGKKGTTEVDDDFLETIEIWRDLLARNIANRNPQANDEQTLNFAVQMTIDRLIFLRICEDRGIEPFEQLLTISKNPAVYSALLDLFARADTRYNSGLFHFKNEKGQTNGADTFTPSLKIDDKVLKEIVRGMYWPCPYIFKEIPVEILGQVYEQFLGKVIRVTPGGHAKVEEKPEVRKAGGVYYTPTYIVEYIVKNTVGKLLEGKTPAEAASLKIVDPACGSGSFLLGAYQHLLKWHEDWYEKNNPETWAKGKDPVLVRVDGGAWRLTLSARKKILVNNIHGVDIDPQAVEVTKLSLLLKVLEEQSGQLSLGFERVLPDLGANIKCGNSLIGPDYFEGQLVVDEKERQRVNPFDWHAAFPQIFAKGGFDAVIGNPPYGADLTDGEREYSKKFNIGTTDTAALMMIQAIEISTTGGFSGFIVPKPFLYSSSWLRTRELIVNDLQSLADMNRAWKNVLLEQIVYCLRKGENGDTYSTYRRSSNDFQLVAEVQKADCNQFGFLLNDLSANEIALAKKVLRQGSSLNSLMSNTRGGMFQNKITDTPNDMKVLGGKQISRNGVQGVKGFVSKEIINLYPNAAILKESLLFQNIVAHIENPTPHIKLTGTLSSPECTGDYLILDTINQLTNISSLSSKYILGLLLSKLSNWYLYRFVFAKAIRTMHFDSPTTEKIPIMNLDLKDKKGIARHDRIAALVTRMLDLHKQTPATPFDQERLARDIASTDAEIDRLVYALYHLTPDEIQIVETS